MAFRHTVAEPASPRAPATLYFTLGTEFNVESGDLFDRVLSGLQGLEVRAVVTVGREVDPARFGPQPDRIRVERFLPQEETLRECDVVVSHAGSGSTLGALAFGRPMVLLPLGADQLLNAERCEELGVAIALDALSVTPTEIGEAITRLLEDASFRERAERIRDEIAAMPPADSLVREIEELARG